VSQVKEDGLDATTYTLSNGIKITIKPTDFKSDELLMTGIKKGGSNNYALADRSNVHFATEVVDAMGVGEFTPNDLEKVTAGKTISVNMTIGDINDGISAGSTVKDFESMLQLMNLSMTAPRKDEGLFKAFKEKQLTMIQFASSNPKAAFADTTVKTLYSNNPMAKMVIPHAADYNNINLDRALEIYRNEFSSADGYHFFIVGNVNAAAAIPLLETYLGSIPSNHKDVSFKDNGVRPIKGVSNLQIRKGKEKQSLVLAIYSGEVPYSEELALKAKALTEVLNIKVIEELREKMGAIYGGGFNSSVAKEPYQRYSIQLQLPCGPDNVDKLLAASDEEIRKLKENGPDQKDLDKVKSQWHEKYVTDIKENKYWVGTLESVLFWGGDKKRALNSDTYMQQLTPADIQATAKYLLNGTNKFVSVLNPES
jgi:zinc protease